MSIRIEEATISDIHGAMLDFELTCEDLIKYYIKRIEKFDDKLNSIIMINPYAIEEAKFLDKSFRERGFVGPLHGIPVLLKDNVDTKDMQTTGGSLSLKGHRPKEDSHITKSLKDAGAIIIAKVNLHEFAIWGETISSMLGQTYNPYDLSRTPGGSSGGTGASVSANFGMVGIGTDTINSVRSPASANNLVGLRPTIGLVSKAGIIPYSLTQDAAGPICRTVEDCAKVLQVIKGYDPDDSKTAWSYQADESDYMKSLDEHGLRGKRIGVLKKFFGSETIHEEVNQLVERNIMQMSLGGATLIDIEDDIDSDYLVNEVSVHLYDLKDHLDTYLCRVKGEYPTSTEKVLESGKYHEGIEDNLKKAISLSTDSYDYYKRLYKRESVRTDLIKLFATHELDALVYPHQKRVVCEVGGSQKERNGVLASVTGFPSICVQSGFTKPSESAPMGVPVGMEILGKPFEEGKLIKMAYALEKIESKRKVPPFAPNL